MKKMTEVERGFIHGLAYAAGMLSDEAFFDQPTLAKNILDESGYTKKDLRKAGVPHHELSRLYPRKGKERP